MFDFDLAKLNSVVGAQAGASIACGLIVFGVGHEIIFNVPVYDLSIHAVAGLLITIGFAKALLHVLFADSSSIWDGVLAGLTAGFLGGVLGGMLGYATAPGYHLSTAYRLFVVIACATPTVPADSDREQLPEGETPKGEGEDTEDYVVPGEP